MHFWPINYGMERATRGMMIMGLMRVGVWPYYRPLGRHHLVSHSVILATLTLTPAASHLGGLADGRKGAGWLSSFISLSPPSSLKAYRLYGRSKREAGWPEHPLISRFGGELRARIGRYIARPLQKLFIHCVPKNVTLYTFTITSSGQRFEHLLWAANFSFWLILLFNFAKTSCLARSQIVACFARYSCNMWSQVWWAEWRKSFVTKFVWHVSAKITKFGWHLSNLLHTIKGPLFKTQCKHR